jgi:4-carboxymuconolactone decarboxylase
MAGDGKTHRFPRVPIGEMDADQRRVADRITSAQRMEGRTLEPDQIIPGPFNAWMQAPELAALLEPLGDYLRFRTSLPLRLSELAILITARHWDSQFEWFMHQRIAVSAGLRPEIAAAIAVFEEPVDLAEDEAAVYAFCHELRRDRASVDATFEKVVALFGHRGAVELMAISGYYDLVSMTLNVAEIAVPRGIEPPLAPHPDRR